VALQLLRSLEEMLLKGATHNLNVRTRSDIALYLLNHKRAHLRVLEERFRIAIMVNADATLGGQLSFVIEKGEQVHSLEQAKALALQPAAAVPIEEDEDEGDDEEEAVESEDAAVGAEEDEAQDAGEEAEVAGEPGQGRKRRRRRRGRRGGEGRDAFQPERDAFPPGEAADFAPAPGEHELARSDQAHEAGDGGSGAERLAEAHGDGERRRRRRGRRGGRRNRRGRDGESFPPEISSEPELASAVHDLDRPVPFAAAEPPAAPIAESEPQAVPTTEPRADVHAPAAARPLEAPSEQVAGPAVPEPTAPEPPRRRSTVREPAPQPLRDDAISPAPSFTPPAPPVEPEVSSSAESDDSDRPRRSGWWSKRVLGKG
jgi:ribonuclease E